MADRHLPRQPMDADVQEGTDQGAQTAGDHGEERRWNWDSHQRSTPAGEGRVNSTLAQCVESS